MKDLDRNKAYNFNGCEYKHLEIVLKWLKEKSKGWNLCTVANLNGNIKNVNYVLHFEESTDWDWLPFDRCEKPIVNALELFEEEEDNPHLSVSWPNIEVNYEIV